MAARTQFRRRNMANRLHRGEYGSDLRMAACANGPGALEYAASVASVAADILVRTVEVKSGTEMIERLLCRRGRSKQQHAEHNGD